MKIEKPVENWTKFPNCILDNLEKFKPAELKILCLMVRKNLGFSNPTKQFSIGYIEKKCRMDRKTVIKNIDSLLEIGSIVILKTGKRNIRYFEINWIEPVENLNRWKKSTSTSGKITPVLVEKIHPVLDNTSEIKQSTRNYKSKEPLKVKTKSAEQLEKEQILINQKDELLNIWKEKTLQLINPDSKVTGYLYGAIKREGFERLKKAIVNYSENQWHKDKKAWNFSKFITSAADIAKFAAVENNGVDWDQYDRNYEAMLQMNKKG